MSDDLTIWDISTGIQDAVLRIEEAQRVVDERTMDLSGLESWLIPIREAELNEAQQALDFSRDALRLYLAAEVKKVDACAEYILFCRAQAEAGRAKEKQVGKVAQGWENRAQRIEDAVMYCLRASGSKLEESATHRLRRQGNGGLSPLTIKSLEDLPRKYRRITLTMNLAVWDSIRDCYKLQCYPDYVYTGPSQHEPDKKAIREALERNEGVFGCSLDERSERLVVE